MADFSEIWETGRLCTSEELIKFCKWSSIFWILCRKLRCGELWTLQNRPLSGTEYEYRPKCG